MDKIIILGHENPDVDSIVSGYLLEKILIKKGYNVEFVIPDNMIDEDTYDICIRYGLDSNRFKKKIDLSDKNNKYILVDHYERDLDGEIVSIIDHHPTTKEINIENYYNVNISSVACYIASNNENLLDGYDLKLAALATLIDTASFHSTKGRKEDRDWVLDICNKYGFDYNELYKEGLCLTSMNDLDRVCFNGLKKHNFDGIKVESSYIQIENPEIENENIQIIIEKLKRYVLNEKLAAFIFIVHDMSKFRTMYYLITEEDIITRYFENYSSRGSTIIPEVEEKMKLHYKYKFKNNTVVAK